MSLPRTDVQHACLLTPCYELYPHARLNATAYPPIRPRPQSKRVDAESAAMLLRLYFGNPRMAVRVKPRVNIVRRQEQEGQGGQEEQKGTGAAERPRAEGQQGRVDDGPGASGGAAGTAGGEGNSSTGSSS